MNLPWLFWVMAAVQVVAALAMIMRVGEPRRPVTPSEAAASVVISGLLIWAYYSLAS